VTSEDRDALKSVMRSFLEAFHLALKANAQLCVSEKDKEFQENCAQQYSELRSICEPLCMQQIRLKRLHQGSASGNSMPYSTQNNGTIKGGMIKSAVSGTQANGTVKAKKPKQAVRFDE
jgi:hypothetical protein